MSIFHTPRPIDVHQVERLRFLSETSGGLTPAEISAAAVSIAAAREQAAEETRRAAFDALDIARRENPSLYNRIVSQRRQAGAASLGARMRAQHNQFNKAK